MPKKIIDLPKRSILKALTYRLVIMCSDAFIIFAITHRFDAAIGVIFFSNLASTILYIGHERLWTNIQWGRSIQKK